MGPSRQNHRTLRFALFGVLVPLLGSMLPEAAAAQTDELSLGASGTLSIPVGSSFKQVPPTLGSRALLTYEASPGRTQVLLSPMPLPKPPSKREICTVVENGSAEIRANAVEKELRLVDLKGRDAEGCYYAATDRAPKPGEHKYLYQGAVGIRDVLVMFTILFSEGNEREAEAALNMVRSLKLVPQK